MTDPVQTTQQTSAVVDSAGGPGGIIGAVLGALTVLGGLWRVIFGSRKERTDANERAAELALRAAEHADERAEHAVGACEEQLREMRAEIRARDEAHAEAFRLVREELDSLRAENKALREQTARQQRAINRLLAGSTPPDGIHPDEVRDEMTRLEDTQ